PSSLTTGRATARARRTSCGTMPLRSSRSTCSSATRAAGELPPPHRGEGVELSPIKRAVALDRDPVAVPVLREVVPHRVVLDATVVPERHGIPLPAETALELRRLGMAAQHRQQRVAFEAAEPVDPGGE